MKFFLDVNQKISNALEITNIQNNNIWEKLDEFGDFQEVIYTEYNEGNTFCTFEEDFLDLYLFLSKSFLVRLFYMEFIGTEDKEWEGEENKICCKDKDNEIFYNLFTYSSNNTINNGYFRGFQILRNEKSVEDNVSFLHNEILKYEKLLLMMNLN